jgi:uncharacterized protein (DUF2267 family)
MSINALAAFDSTLQTTNIWLNELMERMGWQDRQRAYHALRIVLQTLRDHLAVDQAAALGAQLPMLVRGFYYEGWHPSGKPIKHRKKADFLAPIETAFRNGPEIDAEEVVRTVFQILAKHVSAGEIEDVKNHLPREIRELWSGVPHTLWM